jgi:hypothetical protein
MWSGASICNGAFDDWSQRAHFQIDGLLFVDPRPHGSIVGLGVDLGSRHDVRNLLAFGGPSSCAALRGGRVRHAGIEGYNRQIDYQTRGVEGVRFAAADGRAAHAVLGSLPPGEFVVLRDFVLTELPAASLIARGCGAGCDLALRNGFAAWRTPIAGGVASFRAGATVRRAAPLEGLLFERAGLLACGAAWNERGAQIGKNLLVDPPGGTPIVSPESCPLAADQIVPAGPPPVPLPWHTQRVRRAFGPAGPVGLAADEGLTAGADLASRFALPGAPCANRIDDDWDGAIDLADDGCAGPGDPSERRPACGLGFELALLLAIARRLAHR